MATLCASCLSLPRFGGRHANVQFKLDSRRCYRRSCSYFWSKFSESCLLQSCIFPCHSQNSAFLVQTSSTAEKYLFDTMCRGNTFRNTSRSILAVFNATISDEGGVAGGEPKENASSCFRKPSASQKQTSIVGQKDFEQWSSKKIREVGPLAVPIVEELRQEFAPAAYPLSKYKLLQELDEWRSSSNTYLNFVPKSVPISKKSNFNSFPRVTKYQAILSPRSRSKKSRSSGKKSQSGSSYDSNDDENYNDDESVHPMLREFPTYHAYEEALYFHNLLAYPWEKGAFERYVAKLEEKFFPDDLLDFDKPSKPRQSRDENSRDAQKAVPIICSTTSSLGSLTTRGSNVASRNKVTSHSVQFGSSQRLQLGTSEGTSLDHSLWKEPIMITRKTDLPIDWDGPGGTIILIDKPKGWTSFAVCDQLRRLLGIQKVGHAGTLDPMATGLLIVCIGKATKLADSYQAMTKVYTGTFRLGEATPSYDADSKVCERLPWSHIQDSEIAKVKESFIGDIMQVPPMYSAIKVDGERLYKKARRGEEIQVPPRIVSIYELEVARSIEDKQQLIFKVVCSKGTYIRSLCADFGRALNSCAHLTTLRREKIGHMSVSDAWIFSELVAAYNSPTFLK